MKFYKESAPSTCSAYVEAEPYFKLVEWAEEALKETKE